jgi:GxxExxY protein
MTQIEKQMTQIDKRDPITERIIKCCFAVHNELGPGFSEKTYRNALVIALEEEGLSCAKEKEFKVTFRKCRVGTLRVDLVVDEKVIIEIKAVSGVVPKIFHTQVISYLKASSIRTGLLVNFGNTRCQLKRYVF